MSSAFKRPEKLENYEKINGLPKKKQFLYGFKKRYFDCKNRSRSNKAICQTIETGFATKIELKDKNLETAIRNFLIVNIQDYFPLTLS